MRRRPTATGEQEDHAVRFAWWVSFFVTVALVAVLGIARSSQAASTAPDPSGAAIGAAAFLEAEPEEEGEAGIFEEWEAEDCEIGECEDEEAAEEAPSECLLSEASASVTAVAAHDKLRLSVRYTALTPAAVSIGYRLRGAKGSLSFTEQARFSRSGTFHHTEILSEAQMAKVLAAKSFTVQVRALNTPGYCLDLLDQSLTVKRAGPSGPSWSDAASRRS